MDYSYQSLEQRVIASKYEVLPAFYPLKNCFVSEKEQEDYYELIKDIYHTIYDTPSLLYATIHEDYGFSNRFTVAGSNHESTMDQMRKNLRTLEVFIDFLWSLGKNNKVENDSMPCVVAVPARYKKILAINGIQIINKTITSNKNNLHAWCWFASLKDLKRIQFERCIFDPNHDYLTDVLQKKIEKEPGALNVIIDWLNQNGYKKAFTLTKFLKDETYMVSYIKNITKKEALIGFPYMGDKAHIGFSMEYRYQAKNPYFCTIRIQKMKEILLALNTLDTALQSFVFKYAFKCDGCRYCVQTDKTKTRPLANILINNKRFCPYFPGFSFSFDEVTEEMAIDILRLIKLCHEMSIK